jgi:hypothetical protein
VAGLALLALGKFEKMKFLIIFRIYLLLPKSQSQKAKIKIIKIIIIIKLLNYNN